MADQLEKVFVDTNIILDWLAERQPYAPYAKKLFRMSEDREISILISTMSYISTEYILRKQIGKEKARIALAAMRKISDVCISGTRIIDLAIISPMKDFEDAFQYYNAINNAASIIITRNPKDFKAAKIPIMSAEQYVKLKKK